MPNLYIIAGPNGAGKTTASYTLLPDILKCYEFVNADEIAKGLSPFNVEGVAIQSGRLMLQRIDELIDANKDFAFETTLSTRSYQNLIRRAQKLGYHVTLLFFVLDNPEMAIERVKQRVASGGHNIERDVIVRRFTKGLHNLFDIYTPICDDWVIVNNTNDMLTHIAKGQKALVKIVWDESLFNKIESYGRE